MEANATLCTIVRRDSGQGYREMLTRMVQESGIETPTTEDLVRLDRNRRGKKLSNAGWEEPDRSGCQVYVQNSSWRDNDLACASPAIAGAKQASAALPRCA
jgi:hypothetical protein